jgi:hypothetical protein
MKKIIAYEIIDHGVEHSQYFQGCGTAFTEYDEVYTGIGSSLQEALADALNQTFELNDSEELKNLQDEIERASDKDEVTPILERDRPEERYQVKFHAYCGMETELFSGTQEECEEFCKEYISKIKDRSVQLIDDGDDKCWEIQEPVGCVMIPDDAGYLRINLENYKEIMDYQKAIENHELYYYASIRVKYEE